MLGDASSIAQRRNIVNIPSPQTPFFTHCPCNASTLLLPANVAGTVKPTGCSGIIRSGLAVISFERISPDHH